ncbi:MAG TPA: hypothetical protein DEB56_03365 [Thiobacillus sp.]|nr:hypothetical protein [Thiobacillus sp.]
MRPIALFLLLSCSAVRPEVHCADGADAVLDAAPDPAGGVRLTALCGALVVGAQTCSRWSLRPVGENCWHVDCDDKRLWRLCGSEP